MRSYLPSEGAEEITLASGVSLRPGMKLNLHLEFYFPDGKSPETDERSPDELSEKWLADCLRLFQQKGPFFSHSFAGALPVLSHLDGSTGEVHLQKHRCFSFAAISETGVKHEREGLEHFARIFLESCAIEGCRADEEVLHKIRNCAAKSSVLLLDHMPPNLNAIEKYAAKQIALHFGAAYIINAHR